MGIIADTHNIYFLVFAGIIILSIVAVILLLISRRRSQNALLRKYSEDEYLHSHIQPNRKIQSEQEKELSRRIQVSEKISRNIDREFAEQKHNLTILRQWFMDHYKSVGKTKINITRYTDTEYFDELKNIFDLNRNEFVLYCRRYEKWLGSDTFFIIMEDRIGYAPQRNPKGFIYFEDIQEFNYTPVYIKVKLKTGNIALIEEEDFTYNNSSRELAERMNLYLNGYKTPFDIYFDSAFDALEEKATPILPRLIENIEEIDKNWTKFFRAGYKCILCEDGVEVNNNSREALYDIEDILRLYGEEDKDTNIVNYCHVIKARIKIAEGEDHLEIKKILSTVLGSNCDRFIINEAHRIMRSLKIE